MHVEGGQARRVAQVFEPPRAANDTCIHEYRDVASFFNVCKKILTFYLKKCSCFKNISSLCENLKMSLY